jgi:dipeptidyl aminopeptidase/acylaminoacyl peptidase
MRGRVRLVLLALGGIFLSLILVYGWLVYDNQAGMLESSAQQRKPSLSLADLPGSSSVDISSRDGIRLHAVFARGSNRAAVLLIHGFQSSSREMLDPARLLLSHGYGVLIPDLRAHGESGGQLATWGVKELDDLEVLRAWLVQQPGIDPAKVGVLGNSMGAGLGLLYAARTNQVAAVAAVSPYDSLESLITFSVTHNTPLPAFPTIPFYLAAMRLRLGVDLDSLSPVKQIAAISPRPVLIVMGGQDTHLDPQGAARLFDAAKEPRRMWFVPDGGHADMFSRWPKLYEEKVVGFFDEALR